MVEAKWPTSSSPSSLCSASALLPAGSPPRSPLLNLAALPPPRSSSPQAAVDLIHPFISSRTFRQPLIGPLVYSQKKNNPSTCQLSLLELKINLEITNGKKENEKKTPCTALLAYSPLSRYTHIHQSLKCGLKSGSWSFQRNQGNKITQEKDKYLELSNIYLIKNHTGMFSLYSYGYLNRLLANKKLFMSNFFIYVSLETQKQMI